MKNIAAIGNCVVEMHIFDRIDFFLRQFFVAENGSVYACSVIKISLTVTAYWNSVGSLILSPPFRFVGELHLPAFNIIINLQMTCVNNIMFVIQGLLVVAFLLK